MLLNVHFESPFKLNGKYIIFITLKVYSIITHLQNDILFLFAKEISKNEIAMIVQYPYIFYYSFTNRTRVMAVTVKQTNLVYALQMFIFQVVARS